MGRPAAILLLFFGSGAVALSFEGLWFAQAGLAFGNGVWASSVVLSGFMAGMALGNLAGARYADRVRDPLALYALLELAVAVTGVALALGLPSVGRALAPVANVLLERAPLVLRATHFGSSFLLLLVPSCAMGMTLPLLTRAVAGEARDFGRVLGVLYGANTLGATCGVLAVYPLIGLLGIRGSAFVTGALGVAIALVAGLLARRVRPAARLPLQPSAAPAEAPSGAWPWLAAAGLAGFALLALEVIWLRFLLLFLNETPLALSIVLALVLAGIGCGSLIGARLARSAAIPELASSVAYAGGLLGIAGYLMYPVFLQGRLDPQQGIATLLRIAAPLVFPSSLASGALFPLLGAGLRRAVGADAAAAGRLGFVNTVGAALGALLAGFVLLPWLGMERSFLCLFALAGPIALCVPVRRTPLWAWRAVPALVFCVALANFPVGRMNSQYVRASAAKWLTSQAAITDVHEGLHATVVHVVHRHDGVAFADQVVTNSYSMTANSWLGRRYMELFAVLPIALHPRIESALIVGYGLGNTAAALTRSRALERIDVVDVSREMLAQSRRLESHPGPSPLDDPRVRVHIEDGRFYLLVTDARYDLITGEPPPPIMAGVVSLYTAEYFRLVRARLNAGGVATYWLPLMNLSAASARSIIGGFCSAFADCSLWHGSSRNFMLLGTRDRHGPVDAEHFAAQWEDPAVRRALSSIGFDHPTQLPALFIGDAEYLRGLLAGAAPLTDDRPRLIHQPGSRAGRDALVRDFRDIDAARARFADSDLIERLIPEPIRALSVREFETQRLLDALTYRDDSIQLRHTRLLHEVLRKTSLRAPVWLLLGSDPDHQAALERLSPEHAERPAWLIHRAAARLAARDLAGALELLRDVPDGHLPMPDLSEYVAYAVQREEQAR